MQTNRMTWFDNNEPIAVPYYSEDENVCLNKLVFTHEDNPYIPPKGKVTLYTCTLKNYVSLRNTLTCLFSGFITVPNGFQAATEKVNPNNAAFCELLWRHEHELFVIPAHYTAHNEMRTEGGVRLVTENFLTKGNMNTKQLNIYIGDNKNYYGDYLIDRFFEKTDVVKDPVNLYFV